MVDLCISIINTPIYISSSYKAKTPSNEINISAYKVKTLGYKVNISSSYKPDIASSHEVDTPLFMGLDPSSLIQRPIRLPLSMGQAPASSLSAVAQSVT